MRSACKKQEFIIKITDLEMYFKLKLKKAWKKSWHTHQS